MNEHWDMIAPVIGTVSGLSGAITEETVLSYVSIIVAIICGVTTIVQTAIKSYRAIRRAWLEAKTKKAREEDKNNGD